MYLKERKPMKQNLKNLALGLLAGVILSTALYGPMLISIEAATPNGVNVFFGDYGYHFEGAAQ